MKAFLMKNPANKKWVEAQEALHSAILEVDRRNRLINSELYPELDSAAAQRIIVRSEDSKMLYMECMQRRNFRSLMRELVEKVKLYDPDDVPKSYGKKNGHVYSTSTWLKKSFALFFYFHPLLGDLDMSTTCRLFNVKIATFNNWITQKQYFSKWFPFVHGMKTKDMFEHIPYDYRVKIGTIDMDSRVELNSKFKVGSNVSCFSRDDTHYQKRRKIASKSNGSVKYISTSKKSVGSGRKAKYDEQEQFIVGMIKRRWETGNPLSKGDAYMLLIKEYGSNEDEEPAGFNKAMDLSTGFIKPNLSIWFKRVLERHRFSLRKESISQSVPVDWMNIALAASDIIRSKMDKAKVSRLVNADEMFLNYYPKETTVIAPTNVKRVGSNRKEDNKKGCTIMVSSEMFTSQCLAPFVVMTGQPDGYLSRRYADWNGSSTICFQKNHWMDKPTAIKYLDFLAGCFPGEKIGLIWDHASMHVADEVLEYADSIGIVVAFIPAGLTSLMQLCDILINKILKQYFKRRYISFKIRTDPGPGGKYKVERDSVLQWLEEAVCDVNESLSDSRRIEYEFKRLGQDHRSNDVSLFLEHLRQFEENSVYASLMENQLAQNLD